MSEEICECGEDHGMEGAPGVPAWRFSVWDILGIGAITAGNAAGAVAQGFGMLSREFAAAANRSRINYDNREAAREREKARRAMARDLRGIVGFEEVDPS